MLCRVNVMILRVLLFTIVMVLLLSVIGCKNLTKAYSRDLKKNTEVIILEKMCPYFMPRYMFQCCVARGFSTF